jgi:predicted AlkP superfamily pyrophosphatase or phosphodiesterase
MIIRKIKNLVISLCIIFICFAPYVHVKEQPPKVTVLVVIDQGAYHHFIRLSPYFQKGFKTLLQEGISYENAHHPHGAPVTATGHATISSGCLARTHGVTLNSWPDEQGKTVAFGDDEKFGISAHHMLCENLSDILASNKSAQKKITVFALGNKPRAVIALAGQLGKAIWFDDDKQLYTTSKAYFKEIPQWLTIFNQQHNIKKIKTVTWKTRYPPNSPAYNLPFIDNYTFAAADTPLINKKIPVFTAHETSYNNGDNDHENSFSFTPYANENLFELCKTCINTHLTTQSSDYLVLMVTISNLDMLGHLYGPHSREVVDSLYHLDWQIGDFLHYINNKIGLQNVLFILTADHGVAPIPELMQQQGYTSAKRVNSSTLIKAMNTLVEKQFHISHFVKSFKNNQFFFNKKQLTNKTSETVTKITRTLKNFLETQPGIKYCWSKHELKTTLFEPTSLEQFYKNQFYESRSGDLICMPYPYTLITKYETGTGHMSAYAYDTQVPLLFYQKGVLEKKHLLKKVFVTQLAPALAKIYKVPQMPSSVAEPLSFK